ncbi:alpha/beta hydrolase [Zwartia sp.]|uniref:alpha/beta hydrolase n=1 Tax=Zwartia sp. TaxID=2978004 RepID=UPI0027238758|nr:alpha/beta hydrolase [Zwartia sp.]MDO9024383.1 alpha/beta hydrolase [Zwartia sp.]
MLDPQAKALIALVAEKGIPPIHTTPPEQARIFYAERRFFSQPDAPDVAQSQDIQVPGPAGSITVRSYRPMGSTASEILPALVYYHGGGHVIGDLDTHDVLCRSLSNQAGCAVFSVHYRLAPEHIFPAAADDCIAATKWVHATADKLNIDPSRIAIGGDSAGGQLAAVVALALKQSADFKPVLQLLIYPVTDASTERDSMRTNGQGYMLTRDSMDYFYGHYMPEKWMRLDWRASPMLATDHSGLPPALVLTAGYDPLRDEGLAYADTLSAAGVPTQYICFERQIHGFLPLGRILDEANTAVKLCAQVLRDHF